jgi:hypothetical protein
MKNHICVYLIFAILTCLSCVKKRITTSEVFVSPLFEWETSFIGDTIKAEISCINIGNDNIFIDYISTPCGCITAIPRNFFIKKGDSTIIDILYKPVDTGYTEKNIFLYLQNVDSPFLITIKGKIKER